MTNHSLLDSAQWHSWHIYVPQSRTTELIVKFWNRWRPWILESDDSFFFLRYWQGGPHVRIRVRTDTTVAGSIDAWMRSLEWRFDASDVEEYEGQLASQGILATLEGEVPSAARAIGTVEMAEYGPEYGKYGGVIGVEISQEFFSQSSRAICNILANSSHSYRSNAMLGPALLCSAEVLIGSGMDRVSVAQFMGAYGAFWRRYQLREGSVERIWGAVGGQLKGAIEQVLVDLTTERSGQIANAAGIAAHNFRMHAGAAPGSFDCALGGASLGTVVANYMHTNNNRLGIRPDQEVLIAELLQRAFDDVHPDSGG